MEELERIEVCVAGGGVIGLAIAREFARAGREVVLLEAESLLGMHTSSRNSEVIHAGIYYPEGSLKARLCVQGNAALYAYCAAARVPHRRLGKLIVAVRDEEASLLEQIQSRARKSGVEDLEWLEAPELRALEPSVQGVRGLFSPSTGIVDAHGFMAALRRDAEEAGARIVASTPVLGAEVCNEGLRVQVGGPEPMSILCGSFINSTGLRAQALARSIAGFPERLVPACYYAKGHYFVLGGRSPFGHLVYPVPEPGGLGVHVTLDLGGQARFGPDVSWVDEVDYGFDETRAASFYGAIRRYFPGLREGALQPGYVGIRPKLGPPGSPAQDFAIQGPAEHGVSGLVNLFGIESPGLTAALPIATYVRNLLEGERRFGPHRVALVESEPLS